MRFFEGGNSPPLRKKTRNRGETSPPICDSPPIRGGIFFLAYIICDWPLSNQPVSRLCCTVHVGITVGRRSINCRAMVNTLTFPKWTGRDAINHRNSEISPKLLEFTDFEIRTPECPKKSGVSYFSTRPELLKEAAAMVLVHTRLNRVCLTT